MLSKAFQETPKDMVGGQVGFTWRTKGPERGLTVGLAVMLKSQCVHSCIKVLYNDL